MTTWIAEEQVVFVEADGTRTEGRIAIGLPVVVSPGEATCQVALDGFQDIAPIRGNNGLQALLLGVQFLGWRLHDLLSNGGRVVDADGDDVALDVFFGPLLRDPTAN